jgi:hypothetical protein
MNAVSILGCLGLSRDIRNARSTPSQRLRQGLGAPEVRDDSLHAAGGEDGGLVLRPHHRARTRASADEFFDERAADLAAGSGDEDGTQDSTGPGSCSMSARSPTSRISNSVMLSSS